MIVVKNNRSKHIIWVEDSRTRKVYEAVADMDYLSEWAMNGIMYGDFHVQNTNENPPLQAWKALRRWQEWGI